MPAFITREQYAQALDRIARLESGQQHYRNRTSSLERALRDVCTLLVSLGEGVGGDERITANISKMAAIPEEDGNNGG